MRSFAFVFARLGRPRHRARARLHVDADRRDAVRIRRRRTRRAHPGQRPRDLLHGQELRIARPNVPSCLFISCSISCMCCVCSFGFLFVLSTQISMQCIDCRACLSFLRSSRRFDSRHRPVQRRQAAHQGRARRPRHLAAAAPELVAHRRQRRRARCGRRGRGYEKWTDGRAPLNNKAHCLQQSIRFPTPNQAEFGARVSVMCACCSHNSHAEHGLLNAHR